MIAVIGGSGFIGTRLCQRLTNASKDFQIIDKSPSDCFPLKVLSVDIRHPISVAVAPTTTALINLAAEHRDNVLPITLYDEVNVQGALNVCNFAEQNGINKIIFTSSVAVYGFAPVGTDELGAINPFNPYGKTKWAAEGVYSAWQARDPKSRTLVIVRPTVVFGEGNRGNVFNLLRQIASRKFVMIGDGLNRKSMAYVENIAAFLEFSLTLGVGVHIYNYTDKPDFTMDKLVSYVKNLLGRGDEITFRIPVSAGLFVGFILDFVSRATGIEFSVSSIRVRKFCANSVYDSTIAASGFIPPVDLLQALEKTVRHEFIGDGAGG